MRTAILLLSLFVSLLSYADKDDHIYNVSSKVEKLFEKSDKAFNKGKKEKALKYLKQASEKAPGNVQVLDKLAALYYEQNMKLKSQELYESIEKTISIAIAEDTTLTQAIMVEMQLILDLSLKKQKELELEFPSNPNFDGKPLEENTGIVFDMSDPDVDDEKFLTKPKPLNESFSYEEQVKKVQREVMRQYDIIQENDTWFSNDFNKILEINNDWLKYSAISKLNWFSGLKQKEKEFLLSINKNEILRQERERLLNTRTIIMGEIDNIDIKTRWENEKRLELQGKVQTQLKEELKGKLSAIPQSIVIVGRTRMDDNSQGLSDQEARVKRNQKLIESMQKEAIRLVGGQKINMYSSMKDNDLKQFFSTTTEGTAQTIDNYYKDLNREFKNGGKYIYLISRIEVFPLDNSVSSSSTLSSSEYDSTQVINNLNTNIYSWIAEEGLLENCSNSRDLKPYSEHKFKIQEKNYLDFQSKFSESLNQRYKAEIDKAGKEFDQSVEETTLLIKKSLKNILTFNKQSLGLRDSLNKVEDRVKEIDAQMAINKTTTQRLNNEYQVYYKSKNSQVNKLVIVSSNESSSSPRKTIEKMVTKTLGGLEDIRKKSQSLVVYKEVSNAGESVKANELTVEFTPVLRRYRILSMNKFEDAEEDIFYSINIAYDVGWKPISESANNAPEKAIARSVAPKTNANATAPIHKKVDISSVQLGENHLSEPKFKADGSFDLVINGKPKNLLIVPGLSSKVSFSDYAEVWRLPNTTELTQILKMAAINKGTSSDFIEKKFEWEDTYAAFLTSDTKRYNMSEISNVCLELSRSDYSIRTDELLDDEGVYLLLIKK